jgi:hypothetical protein
MLNSMPGTSLMSKIAFQKHEEALKALGLVDDQDKPTWFTDNKPDPIKMLDIASSHAANIPLEKRAAYEKQLFGTQGFGGFALLADPAVKQQVAALSAEMNSPEFKARYGSFMEDYRGASPLQMGRTAWADLQNALMDLGKTVMPAVTTGLKEFDTDIKVSADQVRAFGNAVSFVVNGIKGVFTGNVTGPDPGAAGRLKLFQKLNPTGGLGGAAIAPPNVPSTHAGPMGFTAPPGTQTQGGFAIPGSGQQLMIAPIHVKTALYMDSRMVATAMSSQLARLSTYPGQAPQGDSYASWVSPDYNFATG